MAIMKCAVWLSRMCINVIVTNLQMRYSFSCVDVYGFSSVASDGDRRRCKGEANGPVSIQADDGGLGDGLAEA